MFAYVFVGISKSFALGLRVSVGISKVFLRSFSLFPIGF